MRTLQRSATWAGDGPGERTNGRRRDLRPANIELTKLSASRPRRRGRLIDEFFLRPEPFGDPKEIETRRQELRTLPGPHQRLKAAELGSTRWKPPCPSQKGRQRQAAIATAEGEPGRVSEVNSRRRRPPNCDRQHAENIAAQGRPTLKNSRDRIPGQLAAWETVKSSSRRLDAAGPDRTRVHEQRQAGKAARSVRVGQRRKASKTTLQLRSRTDLTGVTALRSEALADDRFPTERPGPARAAATLC